MGLPIIALQMSMTTCQNSHGVPPSVVVELFWKISNLIKYIHLYKYMQFYTNHWLAYINLCTVLNLRTLQILEKIDRQMDRILLGTLCGR